MGIKLEPYVEDLAQKLYEDDGYSGNIYKKATVEKLRHYENKAIDIIREDEDADTNQCRG